MITSHLQILRIIRRGNTSKLTLWALYLKTRGNTDNIAQIIMSLPINLSTTFWRVAFILYSGKLDILFHFLFIAEKKLYNTLITFYILSSFSFILLPCLYIYLYGKYKYHFSFLALRTPWTVWKGKNVGRWKMNSPGQ